MAATNLKTIDRPKPFESTGGKTMLAMCPGDSFVTRLDFEVSHWISSDAKTRQGVFRSMLDVVGIFATCSDKSPKQAITFPKKFNAGAPKTLFQGPESLNGIRDMVVNGQVSVTAIGYADALVGVISGDSLMSVDVWRQVDTEYAPCVLKGIEVELKGITGGSVEKVRLHFNCPANITISTPTSTSRTRPAPGTTIPAVLMTEGSATSAEVSSGNSTMLMIVIGSAGGLVLLVIGFALFVRNRRQLHK
ncbi:hypothetical protein BCR44DRAFT_38973 [Catenaria anguillulae PL171]|uniref:Uncharacterized protein n=1 Tax=Catenaria anguillulae PL171 TaxID=765915 RepID=A0A1Y2HC70_9FUNG|nr:hypothetical protein BCR44DRAFT_38973 [Catenaria anguillulae PL171]